MIIGGGFGGLAVARGLLGQPFDVLLIDANNFHTFQPLLYQVATAGLDGDEIAQPIRGIVRPRRWRTDVRPRTRRGNIRVRMGRVVAVHAAGRSVVLDDGDVIPYDVLVISAGAVTHHFDVPGVVEHGFGLKQLDEALAIRTHVLDRFERAAVDPSLVAEGGIDVVVCGGGPTGVEMAGGLRELYSKVLARDFPELPVAAARITLVEMADRLLTPFTPQSSQRALQTLRRLGVDVRLGVGVSKVESDRVHLSDGTTIHAHTTIWATGVTAEPMARTIGSPTGRGGRLVVEPDLTIPGHPEIFAIGDVALTPDGDGTPLPQVAQPAIQGGKHVARQLLRRLDGAPPERFVYQDKGQMATIGRHDAVTELANGWRFSGPIGWVAWLGLHLVYLIGFRNRLNVLINWAWNYVTYDRSSRILRESDRRLEEASRQNGAMRL